MPTFFVLMDAFRNDYLHETHTPFLYRTAQEGEHYQNVVQSLGYCERAEILSGCTAAETGFFTAIGFDPENSSYGDVKGLGLLDAAERVAVPILELFGPRFASRAHGYLRRHISNHFRSRGAQMTSHMIPFPFLEYFALTEDLVDHREPGVFPRPSILDDLTESGRKYNYDSFTAVNGNFPHRSDDERLAAVPRACQEGEYDLHLIYVSAPDLYGHKFGPLSEGLVAGLKEMDQKLERWVAEVERHSENNRFVFLGDHGMLSVEESFDAEKTIKRCMRDQGLTAKRDYVYFLDSTMVRFWALSDSARERALDALQADTGFLEAGQFVDEATARRHHAPFADRRYGDLLWLANPGVLVFPDFFHRTELYLGMHGYDPELPESQGLCIHWGHDVAPGSTPSIPLTEVNLILRRSLGL